MSSSYPVRVDATLQPELSRWLWLVKWLLAIPHFVVLFFLWVAFFVLSVCAFLAILVTGRYPRALFAFNVGVLRWSWRVAFYAYGGLGTDQYPPFTLEDRPDFPAHLEISYPERLSRGLVLVKWWLLAIPHLLVVGIFLGGGVYATSSTSGGRPPMVAGGLLGLLVLVAAAVLLFTGRYPRSVFDIVLGLNRWVLRVAAYVALMTDQYPPFRLDLGGTDPGTASIAAGEQAPPAVTAPAPRVPASSGLPPAPGPETSTTPHREWGAGRIVALVAGVLLFLAGCGLGTAGGAVLVGDRVARDAQGYLMSPSVSLRTPGSALVSEDLRLISGVSSALPGALLGRGKLEARPPIGADVFVGVARSTDAAAYLAGVSYSRVTHVGGGLGPTYRRHAGGRPVVDPANANFWVASAHGVGLQSITWRLRSGSWTLVVMNPDGSPVVAADVAVGATVPAAGPLGTGLLVAGGVLVLGSVVLLLVVVRRSDGSP